MDITDPYSLDYFQNINSISSSTDSNVPSQRGNNFSQINEREIISKAFHVNIDDISKQGFAFTNDGTNTYHNLKNKERYQINTVNKKIVLRKVP
jgi:hypothetical protein